MREQFSELYIYIQGTLKHKWLAINLSWIICLAGWFVVMELPNKYTSVAKVHIDSTTLLQPLLKGIAIQQDSRMLVNIMKQLMFTTPNLEKIIQLSNLDLLVENDIQRVELYNSMKRDIRISGGKKDGLFEISYTSGDPNMAKKVVSTVLSVFSEQTQLSSLEDMNSSQKFIENQIREYEVRLREAEKAREEFKRSNFGLLPEEGEGQLETLHLATAQLENASLSLSQAVSKRNVLLAQMQEVINTGDDWISNTSNEELSAEDRKIKELRARKTDLLLKYTKKHPAVTAIDVTLREALKRKKEKERERQGLGLPDVSVMANPYVQKLKSSLNYAEAEVASNSARVYHIKKRIKKYKEQLNSRLSVETEMQNLNRDYETISDNYQQLIQRREQARMSEKVDLETVSIKFKVADPPNKPLSPSGPKRLILISAVLAAGLCVGFGLAYFMYYTKPTFLTTKQLKEVAGVQVLGAISLQRPEGEPNNNKMLLFGFSVAGLVIIYFGLMGFEYIRIQGINPFNTLRQIL